MRQHPRFAQITAAAVAAILTVALLAACTEGADPVGQDPDVDAAQIVQDNASRQPEIIIESPSDGATVQAPFDIVATANNFVLAPKGVVRDGEAHLHVIVDSDCVHAGEVIKEAAGHLHYGDGSARMKLDLPPGDYELCVQAGDGFHVALSTFVMLSVTVAEQAG